MGKIAKEKKGIFFTFISITIMAVFILVFTPQADISLQKDAQSIRTRISSVDNYVSDLQNRYLETVLRATTYKTTLSLIYYMSSTGSYISDLDSAFSEVMLTGKINGVPIDSITGRSIMEGSTLTDWNNRIIQTAKDTLNADTTIVVNKVFVTQTKPWNIDSSMNVSFTVSSNAAKWEKNVTVTSTTGIEGLPDPYYFVNTNGAYQNQIKKSSVLFNQWDITKTREHLRSGAYVHWQDSDAPSFLMRFTNTIAPSSCCGIESLVNPNKISPSDQRESYVDYLFWSHGFRDNCAQLYNINGLWDEFNYFKLDFDHVVKYNVQGTATKTCQ